MRVFTAIVEYWHDGRQAPVMEIVNRYSRLSAMYVCRKRLKTAWQRPGYIPECARVEDADGRVVAAYEIGNEGQVVPRAFGEGCTDGWASDVDVTESAHNTEVSLERGNKT